MGEHLGSAVHPDRRFAKNTPVLFAAIASVLDPKMAARFDTLEKTRDRLGRMFSKRSKGSMTHESVSRLNQQQHHHQHHHCTAHSPSPPPTIEEAVPDPLFPSPSYLRPTASRMQARDEVKVTVRSPRRAQSLPENSTSHERMPSIDYHISTSFSSFFAPVSYPNVPKRSSSLLQRRRDPSIAGLLEFSFSEKRSESRSNSSRSSGTEPASPRRKGSQTQSRRLSRLSGPLPILSARRPDTPPYSDSSNCASPSLPPAHIDKPLPPPPLATVGVFTPEPSPELQPLALQSPFMSPTDKCFTAEMKSQKHRSLETPAAAIIDGAVTIRKIASDSMLPKNVAAPKADFVLEEPTVETFLSLSDDDIADGPPVTLPMTPPSGRFNPTRLGSGRAPTFDLPPDPPVFQMPSPRSGSKRYSPLICLSSPLTSRPAKVAAFECQRIAQRFKFDLIYIVNLWPENIGHTPPSSSHIPAPGYSLGSPRRTRSRTPSPLEPTGRSHHRAPLTGRLLAGHGLANLQTPFMISSAAHTKILRQDGWVEWRDEFPSQDHFSRGYSRAFYAGVSPDPSCTTTSTLQPNNKTTLLTPVANVVTLSEKRRSQQQRNRGIVFAAYRFPGRDGTTLKTDRAQLEALGVEAETLVEMLLDIHKTERSRVLYRDQYRHQHHAGQHDARRAGFVEVSEAEEVEASDETGPLPARPRFEPFLF